jgi:hypothetical protein
MDLLVFRSALSLSVAAALAVLVSSSASAGLCGAYDDDSRTSYRALRWADFQGPARARPARAYPEGLATSALAHVATTVRVEGALEIQERESKGWMARLARLCVRAFMLKDRSHYDRGQASRHDLVHEQSHFDITALYSEQLRADLAELQVVGPSREQAKASLHRRVRLAYQETMAACEREQQRYDLETRIRSRRDTQARWTRAIRARLAANGRPPADPPCVHVASPYWFVGWAIPSPPIGCENEPG